MATPKEKVWYTEEELIQKLQDGEIDWVFFVTHQTPELREEYIQYCAGNALPPVLETSARDFYHEFSREISNGPRLQNRKPVVSHGWR